MNRYLRIAYLLVTILLMAGCSEPSHEPSMPTETAFSTTIQTEPMPLPTTRPTSAETTIATETPLPHGCIYCGSCSPDLPINEEGICQSCFSALQNSPYSFCVDCGASIYDPCSFDPYHCTGCASGGGITCSQCGIYVAAAEAIQWMCVDCYWSSGNRDAHCSRCFGYLDSRTDAGTLCSRCYAFVQDEEPVPCAVCGNLYHSWQMYGANCFICTYNATMIEYGQCLACGGSYPVAQMTDNLCYFCREPVNDDIPMQTCIICGQTLPIYDLFEGECFNCNPYGGMDPSECSACMSCGKICHNSNLVQGLCSDCDPSGQGIWYYCSQCGVGCGLFDGDGYLCHGCLSAQEASAYGTCVLCGAERTADYSDGLCMNCWYNNLVMCPHCNNSYIDINNHTNYTCPTCGNQLY